MFSVYLPTSSLTCVRKQNGMHTDITHTMDNGMQPFEAKKDGISSDTDAKILGRQRSYARFILFFVLAVWRECVNHVFPHVSVCKLTGGIFVNAG